VLYRPARQAWLQSFVALQRVNPKQAIAQPLGGATPQSDAQRAQTLSDSFDSAITSLQSATRTAQAVQQSCNPAGFEQAVQQAIALTAREIAQRPVFFSELDATAQQEVTTAWGDFKTAIGGNLSADDFVKGGAAGDASDRLIYNSSTGALYYDPDGVGGTAQQQIATLSKNLGLTAADFLLIA